MPRRKRFANFRFRLIVAEEYQPMSSVPILRLLGIWTTILLTFMLQIHITMTTPAPKADAIALPEAFSEITMNALAAGDNVAFAKMVSLWLQAFDNQQGQSVPFVQLDYNKVTAWLSAIIKLDGRAQYPLFSAARVYTFIKDADRVRIMTEFIKDEFVKDPGARWEWMATATTLAKNEIDDLELALNYARLLRAHTLDNPDVPNWAKQMEGFLLSDKNEFDQAVDFFLNLLESGEVTDPQEFRLLFDRLHGLVEKKVEARRKNIEKITNIDEFNVQMLQLEDEVYTSTEKIEKIRAKYLKLAGIT